MKETLLHIFSTRQKVVILAEIFLTLKYGDFYQQQGHFSEAVLLALFFFNGCDRCGLGNFVSIQINIQIK
jgi:hypothetical protein